MDESHRTPHAHGVIAIYRDEASAQRAATALRSIGVSESSIRSRGPAGGDHATPTPLVEDHAAVVDAEKALFAGAAGTAIAMAVGAVIGLPFAFIEFLDWPFWLRAISTMTIGALMVGAVGIIAAPALVTRRPDQAAEGVKGVVLAVDDYSTQIAQVITNEKPVRIDLVDDGGQTLPNDTTGR
ncbi:hypothetical protein [Actinomarinicola tropica]|uniref:Uncharacterized protein n=1 Tax=Actinomarinicola tropica TaxID=2789776 RepID=A0A5Q2RMU1_9ACTN|nr:hypothetical protein [Actinomarinicola tropica]QGG95726.1 hypothetical protein GH723_11805 [Actinomarinicola tropica]